MNTHTGRGIRHSALVTMVFSVVLTFLAGSCNNAPSGEPADHAVVVAPITELEIHQVQQAWGEGIVHIGRVFLDNGDYRAAAQEHIRNFYHYAAGPVLFKPTLAAESPFRTTFEGALSYFVAGDETHPEDHGFAIKPWSNVRWENIGTNIIGNMAVAMGQYYFTPAKGGDDVKVEYSFAYTRDADGQLKIILHDSHLPYSPVDNH
jgi:hypothetical protein